MDKVLALLKAHWPGILAFAGAAQAQFGSTVNAWVGQHPKYAALSAFITFAVMYYVKSPLTPKPPTP